MMETTITESTLASDYHCESDISSVFIPEVELTYNK